MQARTPSTPPPSSRAPTVPPDSTPPGDFQSLGLSAESLRALAEAKYVRPTPIQQRGIPPALAGSDVIGCAATGTGKTAAFLLPIIDRLHRRGGLRALVLAPTRELANQIAEHAERFGRSRGFRSAVLIGGVGMGGQLQALRDANIVIATPGRLLDHLQQGSVRLDGLEVLVLDEADRMLDMGFKPQLTRILAKVPKKRQTLLFSATMAGEVAEFARHALHDPVRIEVSRSGATAARATQTVYEVGQDEKTALLLALLAEGDESTLVFTRTKRRADKLARSLARGGHTVERIHANRSQNQRQLALEGFRAGRFRVLVATDIAARGIDVADIGHVVNFDLPHVPEDYVHRIGRTARASASGHASSFCAPEELPLLRDIERLTKLRTPRAALPTSSPVYRDALADQESRRPDPERRQTAGRRPATKPRGQHSAAPARARGARGAATSTAGADVRAPAARSGAAAAAEKPAAVAVASRVARRRRWG